MVISEPPTIAIPTCPQQNQDGQPISVARERKDVKHHKEGQGMTKAAIPWCTGRF